jgi:hypothetical protein
MARRLRRLREPRYLLPTVVGVGWLLFWASRAFFRGGGGVTVAGVGALTLGPEAREGLAFIGSLVLFLWVAGLWLVPSKQAALEFTPAEIHFLFTAPVSRRQIVHYKLLKAQVGILFGAAITAFFWGGRLAHPEGWARLLGFWLLYANLHLHSMGAGFVRNDFIAHGVPGLKRRIVPLLAVATFAVGAWVGMSAAWPGILGAARAVVTPAGDLSTGGLAHFFQALARAGTTGVLGVMLAPFLVLPRLVLAHGPLDFMRWFGAAVVLLGLHYAWVVRAEGAFEEASVEAAQRRATRLERAHSLRRRGGMLVTRARRFPWRLAPTGRPEIAILWKNLIAMTRVVPVRALFAIGAFGLALLAWAVSLSEARHAVGEIAALVLAALAGFIAVFGPLFVRHDLREDLFRIDIVKTFPVPGHAIVWGELLAPAVTLAAIEIAALLVGAGALLTSGGAGRWDLTPSWWLAIAGAGIVVLPALSMASIVLQNALVLLFPAWVSLGNTRARGFEASGQRILTLFGTVFVLGVVALPAAAIGGLVAWALAAPLGPASLVGGAVVTGGTMVGEVMIACRLLGRMLDRLDPSTAGIEAQDD